jgi:hypothetical protein
LIQKIIVYFYIPGFERRERKFPWFLMVGKLNKILLDLEKFWDFFWRWIGFFPTSVQNFSSKYQEINFFRGGWQLESSSVYPCQSCNNTYCSLEGCPLTSHRACWPGAHRPTSGALRTVATLGLKWGVSWPEVSPASKVVFG